MKKIILFAALLVTLTTSAQHRSRRTRQVAQNSVAVDTLGEKWKLYADSLQAVLDRYRRADSLAQTTSRTIVMDPYYFQVLTNGTLYNSPLKDAMGVRWNPAQMNGSGGIRLLSTEDSELVSLAAVNSHLAQMYVAQPSLFVQTQEQLMTEGAMRADVQRPMTANKTLNEKIQLADIKHDVTDTIAAITHRPNFWTMKGNSSLQFTQSHFSDNWFQGGDDNYSALTLVTLEANYDNKQKVQWENKLEGQLGFQTAKSDTHHTLKVTNNLMRFTTKLGFKATKNWFYTGKFQTYTQIYPNYVNNSNKVTTAFAAPLYASLSVGMDYKLKKKRFNGSLYLSPLSVNARYVSRPELRSRYNDNEHQATKWTWGPNVAVNYTWQIVKNVSWQSRLYWFSDFHYTNVEWENTVDFAVNKYLSCKFFAYPKFLDNNKNYRNKNGKFIMFKEWLSMGLSYSW